jgi:predicted transcriptional regulator with HTH domain
MDQLEKFDRLSIYGFKIHHSLSRSGIRRKSILFLYEKSEEFKPEMYKTTVFDISKNINASYQNVKAAISGNGKGYKKDESLVGLGLIAFERVGSLIIYYLTKKGLEVAKLLKELL